MVSTVVEVSAVFVPLISVAVPLFVFVNFAKPPSLVATITVAGS